MTDVVLVHGAFRGGWAWNRVVPLLAAAGARVFTPDLTSPTATLGSYIDDLIAEFEEHDVHNATVVGHSQGGFIARAASQRLALRMQKLIYIDAPVPHHGETAFDFRPVGTPTPPVSFGDLIDPRLVGPDDYMTPEDAAWINERLVAQPVAPSMEPVALDNPVALAIPESYIFFSESPPELPCQITRARLDAQGTAYHLITAGHDGIVTHPAEVADAILAAI